MLVIVLENAPPRLRGYLSRLLLELRAGVFVGDYSARVRERLWETIRKEVYPGNAIMAWATPNDAGFDFDTCGNNRRVPVLLDGIKLCAFTPQSNDAEGVKDDMGISIPPGRGNCQKIGRICDNTITT